MKLFIVSAILTVYSAFGQSLTGVIDLHVQCDPNDSPRVMDAIDVGRLAKQSGLRALVLKHPQGMQAFMKALLQHGLTQAEIDQMAKANPAKVLGV